MSTNLPVLSDGLNNYLVEIDRYPLLSREAEHSLAMRWYTDKDLDAAHELVVSNLRFVVKVALEFKSYGVALKDMIQEGNIGLMHAVKKFDPTRGTRLITYAVWWIKSHIQDYILKTKGLVKRGSRAIKKALFYKGLPSGEEATQPLNDFSLDTPLADGETTHLELMADSKPTHAELIEEADHAIAVKQDVGAALKVLNDNERLVITERIMTEEPKSLQAIGTTLGISRERVRQIEASAKKKLKGVLTA